MAHIEGFNEALEERTAVLFKGKSYMKDTRFGSKLVNIRHLEPSIVTKEGSIRVKGFEVYTVPWDLLNGATKVEVDLRTMKITPLNALGEFKAYEKEEVKPQIGKFEGEVETFDVDGCEDMEALAKYLKDSYNATAHFNITSLKGLKKFAKKTMQIAN